MTIDDMWQKLSDDCDKRACNSCKLEHHNCEIGGDCPSVIAKRIHENYRIVFGDEKTPDTSAQPDNVQRHESICRELNALYVRKNADYGDSFHKTYVDEGMAMARIRLSDKLERFKRLTKSNEQHVQDESVRDTLIDLANYAIMTVMELDGEKE